MELGTGNNPHDRANTFNPLQSGKVAAVALTPLNDSYYADFTLEPPMVRIRAQNQAYLYLSSDDALPDGSNYASMVVSRKGDGQLTRKNKRMGLAYVNFIHHTPTLNPSNNVLYVFCGFDNVIRTVTVPVGFYYTPYQLQKALVTAWLAQIPTLSGVLSAVPPVTGDNQGIWSFTCTQPVAFVINSPLLLFGASTFGFQAPDTPMYYGIPPTVSEIAKFRAVMYTTIYSGPMYCVPTRYVDFMSSTLTKWTKNMSESTSTSSSALIYRLYLPYFEGYVSPPVYTSDGNYQPMVNKGQSNIANPAFFTVNPDESISTIDIKIYDEYGRLLPAVPLSPLIHPTAGIVPKYAGGIKWDLALVCEL